MKHNKYIESITQLEVWNTGLRIRVWRQENDLSPDTLLQTEAELQDALIQGISLSVVNRRNREVIANILFEIDRVNAVEVKNDAGNGVVMYKDWP